MQFVFRVVPAAVLVAFVFLHSVLEDCQGENWVRFRGPNGSGVNSTPGFPKQWSAGDYAWAIDLPGMGHSSPIIHGKKLFVTSAIDEGALHYLHCLDAGTGQTIWSQLIGMNRSHKHNKGSWASSTPTTNGRHVFVAFADQERLTLSAYDFEGYLVWQRVLGPFTSQHGHGVSPIIFEDLVILPNDQMGASSVLAFDCQTGDQRWSALRSIRRTSYSTPLIVQEPNQPPQLICVSGASGITSLNPHTGELNWATGEFPARTVASPVYIPGLILATCGGGGVGKQLISVAIDGKGDVSQTHVRFRRDRTLPYVPTPVYHAGHVYLWNDNGVVSCIESQTGKNIWTKRVGGNFSGSPVCVDGTLYCMSEDGEVAVMAASPDYNFYGKVSLGDGSHATPAVANGKMYLRTFHKLFCISTN